MVSVFLGTQDKSFKRIIDYILRLKEEDFLKDQKIIIQMGQTKYDFKNLDKKYNIEFFDFKPEEEINKIIEKSDFVISHSGVGLLMSAIKMHKKVIIIPRLKKYKEHVNDHQVQIAENFKDENYGIVASNYKELKEAVRSIKDFKQSEHKSNTENFCNSLDVLIEKLVNN